MKVLGVVTARGGSKGLPGKNLRLVAGRPLLAYTLAAASRARLLDRVIVSTDDPQIASEARRLGAEVPFMRPIELAGDGTPTLPVLQHAVRELERQGYTCDAVATLQPTSPLRLADDIDAAVALLLDTECRSVVSLVEAPCHPSRMRVVDGTLVRPLTGDAFALRLRQDFPHVFAENGAIYVTRHDVLMRDGAILAAPARALIMPRERSIDIDDELDLSIAGWLVRAGHGPLPGLPEGGHDTRDL